jgi:hypothetical protein
MQFNASTITAMSKDKNFTRQIYNIERNKQQLIEKGRHSLEAAYVLFAGRACHLLS